ncbi:hypothetical protein Agabi119p4_7307 [Agaricus bisporus var. burnettii]|uniref:Uncharacterized protein n=1 Tax=Agaricus bisporus var. burnettii TaxID=192524 RepID=A0A8H7EYT9_AGABI|nr:hypothetical protein Agabi119p4_7307 [Agaricus bisporus var. burnettii]
MTSAIRESILVTEWRRTFVIRTPLVPLEFDSPTTGRVEERLCRGCYGYMAVLDAERVSTFLCRTTARILSLWM